jgi:hypothetical protein
MVGCPGVKKHAIPLSISQGLQIGALPDAPTSHSNVRFDGWSFPWFISHEKGGTVLKKYFTDMGGLSLHTASIVCDDLDNG